MKLPLLLCALILSLQGWCASVNPSLRTTRAITPSQQNIENKYLQEDTAVQAHEDVLKTVLIGLSLVIYFAALFWWASAAKRSLDGILKDVVHSMRQY